MESKIKAGVIGTGFIGPVHIEAMRRLGNVDVVAVADVDEAAARSKAEQMYIPRAYSNHMDLINDPEVQVVHICSPNHLHYEMAKQALLAGKHVLCEKPLTFTSAEAEELVRIAKEKRLANGIHFNVRFYPLVLQAKEMIRNGDLGTIFAVNGSYQQDWLFKENDYSWRIEPAQAGISRAISDIGSHWMDTVETMTGLSIQKVCADFATFYPTRKRPLKPIQTYSGKILQADDYEDVPVHNEDYATVLLRFDNGAHGSVTVNQVAAGRKNRICFEVYGSKMSLAFNSESPNEMWIGHRDQANEMLIRDPALVYEEVRRDIHYPGGHNEAFPDTTKAVMRHFYSYIARQGYLTDETPDFATFKAGLREIRLCEGIVSSAKTDAWLPV